MAATMCPTNGVTTGVTSGMTKGMTTGTRRNMLARRSTTGIRNSAPCCAIPTADRPPLPARLSTGRYRSTTTS